MVGATIESEAPPPTCKSLLDTFPPAPTKDLKSISGEGAINLIWEPNGEKDLAGYIVFRGVEPAQTRASRTYTPFAPSTGPATQASYRRAWSTPPADRMSG